MTCRLLLIAAVLIITLPVAVANAWDCKGNVPDTQENRDSGLCVLATPTPKSKKHHYPTPVPPTATPVPTMAPTPVPNPTVQPVPPVQPGLLSAVPPPPTPTFLPGTGGGSTLGEYCHYEPTTGLWEIRLSTDVARRVSEGGELPVAPHVCDQHNAAPAPMPEATPESVVEAPVPMPELPPVIEEQPMLEQPVVTPVEIVVEVTVTEQPAEEMPPVEEIPQSRPCVPVQIAIEDPC